MGRYDFSCNVSSEIVASSNESYTVRVHCYWKNNGWTYHMNGIYGWVTCNGEERCVYNNGYPDFTSNNQAQYELGYSDFTFSRTHSTYSVSCSARTQSTSSYASGTKYSSSTSHNIDAKPSYSVSYDANGGSGAPGNQTKWYNETLTLSSTKPTKTGYSFQGWATSSGGSVAYASGSNYTGNGALTLYAVWKANTYTVSYDANGGSGAPGNQTKTYGVNLTLSSTKPTRTNYNFKGWATSNTGSVVYAAGGTYTNNSNITLYAVWELAYVKPRINNFTATRCNSAGTDSETGTYLKLNFSWATDKTVTAIYAQYKLSTATSWTSISLGGSGTSGTVTNKVVADGKILAESTYNVRVYVTDSGGTTYSTELVIGTQKFPIDVKAKGTGIAFGKVAEKDDAVEFGFNALYLGGIKILWYS